MYTMLFMRWNFWGIVKYVGEPLWFDRFTSPYLRVSQTWYVGEIMTVGDNLPQNSTTLLVSKHYQMVWKVSLWPTCVQILRTIIKGGTIFRASKLSKSYPFDKVWWLPPIQLRWMSNVDQWGGGGGVPPARLFQTLAQSGRSQESHYKCQ